MSTGIVVVKVGGGVVASRGRGGAPSMDALIRLLPALAGLPPGRSVLVHGLGSYGRMWLPLYEESRIGREGGFLARKLQDQLRWFHEQIVDALEQANLSVASLDPGTMFTGERGRIVTSSLDAVHQTLNHGRIPVTYGGTLRRPDAGYEIVSSDQVVSALAVGLNAQRVVWITNVDGVFGLGKDGTLELIPEFGSEDLQRFISLPSDGEDCTGGMTAKLAVAVDLASRGIPSSVVNGARIGEVRAAIAGRPHRGTVVRAAFAEGESDRQTYVRVSR